MCICVGLCVCVYASLCVCVFQGGVDINAVDGHNRTALHYAVQSCVNTIIDLLLEDPNANVNIQDKDGNTPAHLVQTPKMHIVVSVV